MLTLFRLLPKLSVLIYSFILPTLVSLYVFADINLVKTVSSSEIDYFVFAQDKFGLILLDQAWQQWLARAFDFILWGIIGGIFLFIFWAISASRIAVHNHRVQAKFVNFNLNRSSWHGHFITIAVIKTFITITIIYGFIILIFYSLPNLIESVTLVSTNSSSHIWDFVVSFASLVLMQYVLVFAIKLFKTIRVDA